MEIGYCFRSLQLQCSPDDMCDVFLRLRFASLADMMHPAELKRHGPGGT
jgi:hypothetical protein